MEPRDVLEELGLTETETRLYMTLLREEEGTASKIAEKAGVGRRVAYDRFTDLREKGLVSYVEHENHRVYTATDPRRLEELIEDRRSDLDELEQKVSEVMPELLRSFSQQDGRNVRILEGKEGIKQLFNDQLRQEDEEILLMGSPIESEQLLEHFLPSWTKKRKDQDVKLKGVFENEMRGMVGQQGAPTEARFLKPDQESKVSISIYGQKVGIVFWIREPLVIMIEDAEAAESFTSYFTMMWAGAEP